MIENRLETNFLWNSSNSQINWVSSDEDQVSFVADLDIISCFVSRIGPSNYFQSMKSWIHAELRIEQKILAASVLTYCSLILCQCFVINTECFIDISLFVRCSFRTV